MFFAVVSFFPFALSFFFIFFCDTHNQTHRHTHTHAHNTHTHTHTQHAHTHTHTHTTTQPKNETGNLFVSPFRRTACWPAARTLLKGVKKIPKAFQIHMTQREGTTQCTIQSTPNEANRTNKKHKTQSSTSQTTPTHTPQCQQHKSTQRKV
jgi:hypothetical protein